jgi:acetyl esterase/lipase
MKLFFLAVTLLTSFSRLTPAQELIIPLYPDKVPNSKTSTLQEKTEKSDDGIVRISNVSTPTLIVYRPAAGKANGTSVIICPGGGYSILAIDHEGYQVARRFNEMGVTAFVLKYRLPNEALQPNKTIAPLQDVQQAFRVVRQRGSDFGLNADRVGVMGFSAGGHLASTAGTHFEKPVGEGVDATNVRPDFQILIYPVISFTDSLAHGGSRANLLGKDMSAERKKLYSNELQVTPRTPPAFLVHSADDGGVKVQNSIQFYLACLRNGVPAEMHLYPKGGHGYGMNNKTTPDKWMDRLQNWMQANGWL